MRLVYIILLLVVFLEFEIFGRLKAKIKKLTVLDIEIKIQFPKRSNPRWQKYLYAKTLYIVVSLAQLPVGNVLLGVLVEYLNSTFSIP